jgi:type IX secretion system PorP/SprF family membrane protein
MCKPKIFRIPHIIEFLGVKLYRLFFALFFLFSGCFSLFSQQENKSYPVQFNLFAFSYPLINPASMGITSKNEILMGYQKPVNGFEGVLTYICNVSFTPFRVKSSSGNKSVFGIRFYNDIEGAYINRMRFYGMYAFHTHLNPNLNLSGGLEIGGLNYAVKSTPTTEGASSFNIDANAGIWLYNNNFHTGISVNQLFNSKLQPLDEKTILATHINLSASYAIIKNDYLVIRPHLLLTMPYYSGASLRANLHGLILNKVITAFGWNRNTNVSFIFGLNKITIYKGYLNLLVSYNTSIKHASLGINQFEIVLKYSTLN